MSKPYPSDRAILAVMQFYRMTEADVRELYMDEVYAMQKLHNAGIDLGNPKNIDEGNDE